MTNFKLLIASIISFVSFLRLRKVSTPHGRDSLVWGMGLHHPFSDGDSRRNQSMKSTIRVVVGSAVGGLLGAAAFFAVDGLIPPTAEAGITCRHNELFFPA